MAYVCLPAILCWFVALGTTQAKAAEEEHLDFRSLNGSGNNKKHPTWGEGFTQFPRVAPAHYPDGTGTMASESERPNPRYISNRVFNAFERDIRSKLNESQWVWTWGQFVDHTLDLAQTGNEAANIPFNQSDPLENFKDTLGFIPFTRNLPAPGTGTSPSNPRQFLNTVPSFIEGFDVYGSEQSRLDWIRTGPDNGNPAEAGAELMLPGGYLPRATARGNAATAPEQATEGRLASEPQNRVVTGDKRGNENAELTATTTLLAREHNRIVHLLPNTLSNEEKFQIARKVVGAEQQYITYHEWLPAQGITLARYGGYNPSVNPSVSLEFATTGFRFHSEVNGEEEVHVSQSQYTSAQLETLRRLGVGITPINTYGGNKPGFNLNIPQSTAFFNPSIVEAVGLGTELQGLARGPTDEGYRNDEQITNQLRSVLFQLPGKNRTEFECFNEPELPECFTGASDLGAIDVQRGFDHGVPGYNELREAYGLAPQKTFDEVSGDSSEELPAGDTINTPAIMAFTGLANFWHEPLPVNSSENATYDTRASTLAARLKAAYGSVDHLDAFTGMVSEPALPGSEVGELQNAIVRKQFEVLRDGDRFFYLNDPALRTIEHKYGVSYKHSLGEIIAMNTGATEPANVFEAAPPPHHIERPRESDWAVSGNVLTDKNDATAVALPDGATFNGSGEVNHETGAGSISGAISIPPFTSSVDLGSRGEASLGMTMTPGGAVAASTAASEGLEALSVPLKLDIGFTSINGQPISCKTAEPVALDLTDTLGLEELLTQGWRFTGTTAIPEIKCEGGSEAASLGRALSAAFSGPSEGRSGVGGALSSTISGSENPFSLAITAPASKR